jgi:hypothetical protein
MIWCSSDIGIAEPSPLLGCGCNGMVGCEDSDQCSCQAVHEHRPAYTQVEIVFSRFAPQCLISAQGLFTFNTELEIIECNNVRMRLHLQYTVDISWIVLRMPAGMPKSCSAVPAADPRANFQGREARVGCESPCRVDQRTSRGIVYWVCSI